MKAYCINLDRRPDRLAYMTAEFARRSVPFIRVRAVDGQEPAIAAEAEHSGLSTFGLPIGAGSYACFQSHRAVWQMIVDSGEPFGMVFEDDVLLSDGIAQYLDDGWVPDHADIVRMETFGLRIHIGAGRGFPAGPRRLHRLRSYHHGTGGYVVAAATAARLIAATARIIDPVDYVLFHPDAAIAASLTTWQMAPAPVIQGFRANVGADWAATSIVDRFGRGPVSAAALKEAPFARLRRRMLAEVQGLVNGTRYRVIAHG